MWCLVSWWKLGGWGVASLGLSWGRTQESRNLRLSMRCVLVTASRQHTDLPATDLRACVCRRGLTWWPWSGGLLRRVCCRRGRCLFGWALVITVDQGDQGEACWWRWSVMVGDVLR